MTEPTKPSDKDLAVDLSQVRCIADLEELFPYHDRVEGYCVEMIVRRARYAEHRCHELEERLERTVEWANSHYSDLLKIENIKRIAEGGVSR